MPLIIFPVIFLFLLELATLAVGSYSWLPVSGVFIISLVGAWRVSKERTSLPLVFFLSLLSILFLNISHNLFFSQLVIGVVSFLYCVILFAYARRSFLPIIFSSFIVFIAGVLLMLIYQITAAVSWPLIALFIFSLSFLLFFSGIYFLLGGDSRIVLRLLCFSSIAGFIITEFYFALSNLPFNLVSIDFLVFIIYYGLWDLAWRYFSRRLTKKSLILNAGAVLISFAVVFLSAKWFPN